MQKVYQESLRKKSTRGLIAESLLNSRLDRANPSESVFSTSLRDADKAVDIWQQRKQLVERMTGKSFFEMLYAPLLREQKELVERTRCYRQNGCVVKVLVIALSASASTAVKRQYAQDFMGYGGFSVETVTSTDRTAIFQAVKEHKADGVVLCGDWQEQWQELLEISRSLKEQQREISLFIAEVPRSLMMDSCLHAGIEDFIYEGANCYRILRELQKKKGME